MKSDEEVLADRQRQVDEFMAEIEAGGWKLYPPEDWKKIEARYRADRDLADTVPRNLIYWDIATLIGHIMNLELELKMAADLIEETYLAQPKKKKPRQRGGG